MKTILIIDDEEPLRLMLVELLRAGGYGTVTAAGGQQGVRLARAHRPDLVLTDIRMPEMDGHTTLAELRRIPGFDSVPVIIMTAHADLADMRRSMALGADDYVAKPFDSAELLRVVAQHLGRAEHRKREAGRELDTFRRSVGQLLPQQFIAPLHEIIGCASVLAVDAAVMPAGEVREFAQNIQEAAERLHRHIENFLLYSTLEGATAVPAAGAPVAIDELVRQSAEPVARRHHRVDTLRFALHPVRAPVAREHLAKIVAELVDNACRHTPPDVPVQLSLSDAGNAFVLRVADAGPGLPSGAGPQGDAWASAAAKGGSAGGAGLGLFLSRRLTQLLGGSWELTTQPRLGTTVTLTFPVAERPADGA